MPHRFRCSVTGGALRRTTLSCATTPLRLSRLQAYSRARRAVRGDGPAAAADPAAARPAARAGGARGAGSRPPEHSAGRAPCPGTVPTPGYVPEDQGRVACCVQAQVLSPVSFSLSEARAARACSLHGRAAPPRVRMGRRACLLSVRAPGCGPGLAPTSPLAVDSGAARSTPQPRAPSRPGGRWCWRRSMRIGARRPTPARRRSRARPRAARQTRRARASAGRTRGGRRWGATLPHPSCAPLRPGCGAGFAPASTALRCASRMCMRGLSCCNAWCVGALVHSFPSCGVAGRGAAMHCRCSAHASRGHCVRDAPRPPRAGPCRAAAAAAANAAGHAVCGGARPGAAVARGRPGRAAARRGRRRGCGRYRPQGRPLGGRARARRPRRAPGARPLPRRGLPAVWRRRGAG